MMTDDTSTPMMHQEIFRRGLPTETISLYLLCCGLLDTGQNATRSAIAARWNAGIDTLEHSLRTLLAEGILSANAGPPNPEQAFSVMAPRHWRPRA